MLLVEVLEVLGRLDAQKTEAEEDRRRRERDRGPRLSPAQLVHRERDGVAAHEQDRRIGRPQGQRVVEHALAEADRMLDAIGRVEGEETREEEHLAAQEHPHPQARRVGLARQVLEVLGGFRLPEGSGVLEIGVNHGDRSPAGAPSTRRDRARTPARP